MVIGGLVIGTDGSGDGAEVPGSPAPEEEELEVEGVPGASVPEEEELEVEVVEVPGGCRVSPQPDMTKEDIPVRMSISERICLLLQIATAIAPSR